MFVTDKNIIKLANRSLFISQFPRSNPLKSRRHVTCVTNCSAKFPPMPPLSIPSLDEEGPAAITCGGTLTHKSFYDLLALIPTSSPSRIGGAGAEPPDVVTCPR